MDIPKSLKKALAIAGIASGLSGIGFGQEKQKVLNVEKPDAVVDVSKIPTGGLAYSLARDQKIHQAMEQAADTACHIQHLLTSDNVFVKAEDGPGKARYENINCGEAHSTNHVPSGKTSSSKGQSR